MYNTKHQLTPQLLFLSLPKNIQHQLITTSTLLQYSLQPVTDMVTVLKYKWQIWRVRDAIRLTKL